MKLEKNGVRKKSFLVVLVFRHLYCSNINSTAFNVEHENTCPFHCHIGRSINSISAHGLTCNCAKNYFIIFCIKFSIYRKTQKKKIFFERTAIKFSFSFFFFTIPKQRNSMEMFYPKMKSCNIFPSTNSC